MNEQQIISRLTAIEATMVSKGLERPETQVHVSSSGRPCFHGSWDDKGASYGTTYEVFHGSDANDALTKAEAHFAALPDAEELGKHKYMKSLGETLEVARKESIPHEFVAGARQSMDAISEHLLEAPKK